MKNSTQYLWMVDTTLVTNFPLFGMAASKEGVSIIGSYSMSQRVPTISAMSTFARVYDYAVTGQHHRFHIRFYSYPMYQMVSKHSLASVAYLFDTNDCREDGICDRKRAIETIYELVVSDTSLPICTGRRVKQ